MRFKRSYHTSLILLYQAHLLPIGVQTVIPRTTLQTWKSRDLNLLVGNEQARLVEENTELLQMLARHEKMLAAAKVLLMVFKLYRKTLLSFNNGKKRLLENRQELIRIAAFSANKISVPILCRLLCTSPSYLKNAMLSTPCRHAAFKLCKRIFPSQLSLGEVAIIKKHLSDRNMLHWPLASVYFKMLRDKKAFCSLSAFYKYARKLGIKRVKYRRKNDRNTKGLRATAPLQILHMDFTMLRLADNTKAYLHFITDNFSRRILAWNASLKPTAHYAAQNLRHIITGYHLPFPPVLVITDDGSENKGQTAELFAENPDLLKQLIAQRDIIFSNSMAEATNKSMKYYHLFNRVFNSFETLQQQLPVCVQEYNTRPMKALCGFIPDEAFERKTYGTGLFAKVITDAKRHRIAHNKAKSCGIC